jgi:hypothetical protein
MPLKVIAGHQTSSNAIDMYHNKALSGKTMAWKEMAQSGQKNKEKIARNGKKQHKTATQQETAIQKKQETA